MILFTGEANDVYLMMTLFYRQANGVNSLHHCRKSSRVALKTRSRAGCTLRILLIVRGHNFSLKNRLDDKLIKMRFVQASSQLRKLCTERLQE